VLFNVSLPGVDVAEGDHAGDLSGVAAQDRERRHRGVGLLGEIAVDRALWTLDRGPPRGPRSAVQAREKSSAQPRSGSTNPSRARQHPELAIRGRLDQGVVIKNAERVQNHAP
jgi:hypothetical protein